MVKHYNPAMEDSNNQGRSIIMHPLYFPRSSNWLDLKVFYVRVSSCQVDESTPGQLTVNHVPLTPDTILEVNGRRSSIHSECVSSVLRRDRIDKRSEEATYVSTDSISITGGVRFEVYAGDDMLLSGVLELSGVDGSNAKKWRMRCQPAASRGGSWCLLKEKQNQGMDMALPAIEVYIAGCFSGNPVVLTKNIQIGIQKKMKLMMLNSIPEDEPNAHKDEAHSEDMLQLSEYQDLEPEHDIDIDYKSLYPRTECFDAEDGELSWFNAGVRVGMGLGLGICLGVGVGVGLLVRSYQATTRTFRRRII